MKGYASVSAAARQKEGPAGLEVVHPDAAGIDVGAGEMWVCVPAGRAPERVRRFGTVTSQLLAIADWLKDCGVDTVAMESTGVYWIALFQVLESRGFAVYLVNARHVKNVPGRRKTDRLDCQWLQKLHACGLLRASFRPTDRVCALRSLLRQRETLIRMASRHIQHMQKALREMNVLLDQVTADITGTTGMRIIDAILGGCRDYAQMARLRDQRLQASEAQIAEALRGDYRPEHLFVLKQALAAYRFVWEQIRQLDAEVEQGLNALVEAAGKSAVALPEAGLTGREKRRGNAPDYDVQAHLYRLTGVDLARIPGLGAAAVQTLVSETGIDMTRWPTDKHFASWLGLAPDPKVSGGQVIGQTHRHVQSRAARVLRVGAMTLRRSPTWLGAFYRRIKARSGGAMAITATAHKLALIYYTMLRTGQEYRALSATDYEQRFQERMLRNLRHRAQQCGFNLVAAAASGPTVNSAN